MDLGVLLVIFTYSSSLRVKHAAASFGSKLASPHTLRRKTRDVPLASILGSLDPDADNLNTEIDNTYFHAPMSVTSASVENKSTKTISALIIKSGNPNSKYKTTPHIKELFIGRCYEYQFRRNVSQHYNCDSLWNAFFNSFAYKDPCDVQSYHYKKFLDMIEEDIPKDKALLWSGSRELAHKFSDFLFTKRFTTLEDTMAGYLVNDMKWCGKRDSPGINFKECPWECSIQTPYWSSANQRFAKKIRGVVQIILNGTRQHLNDGRVYPSYMKNRYYLGPYIIPEFKKENIRHVKIIVAHTLHLKPLESCNEKTVKLLVEDIKKKNIPVNCVDDADTVKHILCVDDPLSNSCLIPK
ncbi:ADP-ribosyl cyclase/cyclic ADP-ribose hydrolase-like [Hydractinia symbiolongicarpus]|uniref:ADP-ribosyl cyclase/cyclic ADP-ribose hydrolase-like n=1 Tax=Hydractinia symbiolongicarpus TaxID=13093 RepID=UPI0025508F2B|nr:ADP-ribosyl cyclase/cyclic ADP-ribose hydrolase-like [Hydractinia symbiolongicarpus]